jgi:predicted amidohydrolase
MMSLAFQEPQQVFGGQEKASALVSNLDTLKKNYEEDFNKMLDAKKFGPYIGLTRVVVTPEYTLPGGRSRYFRYLFSGSS